LEWKARKKDILHHPWRSSRLYTLSHGWNALVPVMWLNLCHSMPRMVAGSKSAQICGHDQLKRGKPHYLQTNVPIFASREGISSQKKMSMLDLVRGTL